MSGKGFGAGFGLLLALGAGALLLWNESRSVSVADSLWLGERAVKIVPADRVDPANEGRLVFVRGPARAAAPIVDPDTGATLRALYATRKVEMFQWREQSTSRRGNADPASVTLNPAWSERAEPTTVTMQARRLENPLLPFAARRLPAEGARLGAFGLTTEALAALPRAPGAVEAPATVAGRPVARQAEALFVGQRPQTPEIGDLRIAYALAPEGEVSLVGRQVDGRIAAHRDADGATILLGAAGLREPADLFGAARGGNATLTWGLRLTGALAMWGAFALLLGRLTAIGELIPLVGGLLASGSRLVAFVAAALVTTLLVAGGWLIARPLPALALLAAIAAAIALWRARARRGPPPSALPRP